MKAKAIRRDGDKGSSRGRLSEEVGSLALGSLCNKEDNLTSCLIFTGTQWRQLNQNIIDGSQCTHKTKEVSVTLVTE